MAQVESQPSLFDLPAAVEAKHEAIERVGANANQDWHDAAINAVEVCCRYYVLDFTTDDVWRELAKTEHATHEPRAMGAIMTEAARMGWCQKTGQMRASERKACHNRPLSVWKSAII